MVVTGLVAMVTPVVCLQVAPLVAGLQDRMRSLLQHTGCFNRHEDLGSVRAEVCVCCVLHRTLNTAHRCLPRDRIQQSEKWNS